MTRRSLKHEDNLLSREAALRHSGSRQNTGYWRQISRPTSSRRRCFSVSPIVRIQGAISVGVSEAALQTEVEVEGTPPSTTHDAAPPSPAADPESRRPADGQRAAAAQTPARGRRRACAATPPAAGQAAVRRAFRHPAQGRSGLLVSPLGQSRAAPGGWPLSPATAPFWKSGGSCSTQ